MRNVQKTNTSYSGNATSEYGERHVTLWIGVSKFAFTLYDVLDFKEKNVLIMSEEVFWHPNFFTYQKGKNQINEYPKKKLN